MVRYNKGLAILLVVIGHLEISDSLYKYIYICFTCMPSFLLRALHSRLTRVKLSFNS